MEPKDKSLTINIPTIHETLSKTFYVYEKALVSNDVPTLDDLFWSDEKTVRFGATEVLFGHSEILAFRRSRPSKGLDRNIQRAIITTFGNQFGTTSITFRREGEDRLGRQTQSWINFGAPHGWKIVAAHVSLM